MFNIDTGKKLIKRMVSSKIVLPIKTILLSVLLAAIAFGSIMGFKVLYASDVPLLVRDFAIAIVAHIKAGDKVSFDVETFSYIQIPQTTWGIQTNSPYLVDWVVKIVPFYEYEKVTPQAIYPVQTTFEPILGASSFHLLGQASCAYRATRYNMRILQSQRWNDERTMLSVMIHELAHVQGGNYCSGTTQEREAHTQAATLEVLAAMCNYGEELACSSFWREIESFARDSLRIRLNRVGLPKIYDVLSNILWRDADQERSTRKAMRYWADDETELIRIITDYGQYPWERYIIPGINGGRLNTGLTETHSNFSCDMISGTCTQKTKILGMPWDDTADLLGFWKVLFLIGS